MTQLPLWAVYAVAFGTPLSALLGLLINVWITYRAASRTERRAGREELLRNLRWAADLAADDHEVRRRVGVGQLVAWGRSAELEPRDQVFVDAALRVVLERRRSAVERERGAPSLDVAFAESVADPPEVTWTKTVDEQEGES